jgi:hypothetical protein
MRRPGPRPRVISRDDVVKLLEEARAPKPWARLDLCELVASFMTHCAQQIDWQRVARKFTEGPTETELWQGAIDQLRDCLSRRMQSFSIPPSESIQPGGQYEEHTAQYVRRLAALDAELLDLRLPEPVVSLESIYENWHSRALFLFNAYADVVGGKPGTTRKGPAVRFVKAALPVLDPEDKQPHEAAAIEQALRRRLRKSLAKA